MPSAATVVRPSAPTTAKLGRQLAWITRLMTVPLFAVAVLRWWVADMGVLLPQVLADAVVPAALTMAQRLAGSAIDAAITAVAVSALLALARIGDRFRDGTGLSAGTAGLQIRLGRRLMWLAGAQFAYTPAVALAVTLFNPPGQRLLVVGITGTEMLLLVAAIVVLLFGRITEEAARLAEDNAQIV